MATSRTAATHWEGTLFEGAGSVTMESSGIGTYDVTWASRAEQPEGRTSPEELIAGAHSACFSMALSKALNDAGSPATSLDTQAEVSFTPGPGITGVHLSVRGVVEGLDEARFRELAEGAKDGCPVSQALTGTTITVDAALA